MFSLLLAIIYLSFISLGLPDSLLGSAWSISITLLPFYLSAILLVMALMHEKLISTVSRKSQASC